MNMSVKQRQEPRAAKGQGLDLAAVAAMHKRRLKEMLEEIKSQGEEQEKICTVIGSSCSSKTRAQT